MSLSNNNSNELKSLYLALADRALAPHDPVYVAELNAIGSSGSDPILEIAQEIDWQAGGGVSLFTGQRGTGKSTELLRLKEELESRGMVVFYADISEYLIQTKPIEISDFLITIAGALSQAIDTDVRFKAVVSSASKPNYWERLSSFMQTEVALDAATVKLGVLDLKLGFKEDPDFKQTIQKQLRGSVAKLVQQVNQYIMEMVSLIRDALGNPDQKVVVIVDSIERLRGIGPEAMEVYESVRNLFFGHGDKLRLPLLHMVYTVPPYLSVLSPAAGTLLGGIPVRRLVSTHVFQKASRAVDPDGIALMQLILTKRYTGWRNIVTEQSVSQLAENSGGDLREFFRLIRQCLPSVREDAALPLSPDAIAHVFHAARNEMLPIPAEHLDWLKRIATTNDVSLRLESELPLLAHFLDNRLVFNYRNGVDWYDVHPLLREVVDRHA